MSAEIDPEHIHIIEEAQRLRGWITNAYAQIEYLLGDLIYRLKNVDEYKQYIGRLPHGAPDRVKKVRNLLNKPGSLIAFREALEDLMSGFEQMHETRNLISHGFCEFLYTEDGDTGLYFQKWHRDEKQEDIRLIRFFRLVNLEYEQVQIVHLSQKALELFQVIHRRFGWVEHND